MDKNFRDLKVKVCELIFAIFIFAISNEPTFELDTCVTLLNKHTWLIADELDTFEYPVNWYLIWQNKFLLE